MITQPYLTVTNREFAEKTTVRIYGSLADDEGTALPASALQSLLLTIYNKATGGVLRAEASILNVSGGTVDEDGVVDLVIPPSDTALESQANPYETHVAAFSWTYNGAARTGRALVEYRIRNLVLVT